MENEEKVLIIGTIHQVYPHPERLEIDQDRFPTFWFRFEEARRMARCVGKSAQGGATDTPFIEFSLSREQVKKWRAAAAERPDNCFALVIKAVVKTREKENRRYVASLSTIDSMFWCDDERITGVQEPIAMPLPAFKVAYANRFDQQPHRPNDSFQPEPRCSFCGVLEKTCNCEFRRELRAKEAKKRAEQAEYEEKIKRGGAAAIYARRAIPHSIFAQEQ